MRRLLATVFFLLCSSPLYAQTHYCDAVQPTSGTAITGQPATLQVCSSLKDANGNPTTITGWAVYDNGTRTTPTLTAGSVSPVSGKQVFSLTVTAPAVGVHTYQAAAINAGPTGGEGVKSTPFVLTINPPPTVPAQPTNLTVQ